MDEEAARTKPGIQTILFGETTKSGISEEVARACTERILSGDYDGALHTSINDPGADEDYLVFVNGVSDATRRILGGHITLGEHYVHHTHGPERYMCEYIGNFHSSEPTLHMIGFLGQHVASIGDFPEDHVLQLPRLEGMTVNHWLGHHLGTKIINSGQEAPFKKIFHAHDKMEIWCDIVDSGVLSRIDVPIAEASMSAEMLQSLRDGVYYLTTGYLDIPIEFV